MIDRIIDLINNCLDGIVENQITIGLTQRVYRINNKAENNIDFMPGVVLPNGEAIYAGIDDINGLNIYHKINAANLSYSRSGFGDNRQNDDNIGCSLIASWDTRKTNICPADMLLLLRSRMPQIVKGISNLKNVIITPIGAQLNTKSVFESEYSIGSAGYILPLYINFIQINYNITISYDPECMDKCINNC